MAARGPAPPPGRSIYVARDVISNDPADDRSPADGRTGRQASDAGSGEDRCETIKPGRVPFRDGRPMAPHPTFWITARGVNIGLHTRLYVADEAAANAEDPVLARIEHRARVDTLTAARSVAGGVPTLPFRDPLQGPDETAFFDI